MSECDIYILGDICPRWGNAEQFDTGIAEKVFHEIMSVISQGDWGIANKLAKGFPHVRVDLYNVNGKIFFGELTFFVSSGFLSFYPDEYDFSWGKMLKLPDPNFNLDLLERIKHD